MDDVLDPTGALSIPSPATLASGSAVPSAASSPTVAPVLGAANTSRTRLRDWDWQQSSHVVLTLLGCLALFWVLWQLVIPISGIVVLFLLSGVLAFVLAPPVNALAARIQRRVFAILAVYVLAGVVLIAVPVVLAQPFAAQATALVNELPTYASELQARAPEIQGALGGFGLPASVDELKASGARALQQGGGDILTHLAGTAAGVGSLLANTLLALVISFYLLVDGPGLRARAHALVPAAQRDTARFVEENVSRVLGAYLCGQVVIAAVIGVLAGIGCGLLGVPYAVVLGVLAGLFALIPMLGPILSAAPAVLIALFMPFPTVLWVLIFFFVIQQIAFNVLGPRITGHAVGLHPLAALFVLLVGFQVAGILGGLFAVPVAGILWVLVAAAYRHLTVPSAMA